MEGDKRKILIVDDEKHIVELIELIVDFDLIVDLLLKLCSQLLAITFLSNSSSNFTILHPFLQTLTFSALSIESGSFP